MGWDGVYYILFYQKGWCVLPVVYVGVVFQLFCVIQRDIFVVVRLMLQAYCCKMTNGTSCKQLFRYNYA